MNWRPLDITPRDVTLATGESLRTLASFQGFDGQSDILRAHLALDGGDIVLLTEFEDASGKRQLGRTTQWPAQILSLIGATSEFEYAVRGHDGEDAASAHEKPVDTQHTAEVEAANKAIMDSLTSEEIIEAGSASLAYMRKKAALAVGGDKEIIQGEVGNEFGAPPVQPPAPNTETTPESEATGGSGDTAAPAVPEQPDPFADGPQPETTGSEGPGATEESGNSPSLEAPTPEQPPAPNIVIEPKGEPRTDSVETDAALARHEAMAREGEAPAPAKDDDDFLF